MWRKEVPVETNLDGRVSKYPWNGDFPQTCSKFEGRGAGICPQINTGSWFITCWWGKKYVYSPDVLHFYWIPFLWGMQKAWLYLASSPFLLNSCCLRIRASWLTTDFWCWVARGTGKWTLGRAGALCWARTVAKKYTKSMIILVLGLRKLRNWRMSQL